MTERESQEPVVRIRVTEDGEILATAPSGRVTFMGFWEGIKACVRLVWRGHKVEVEE